MIVTAPLTLDALAGQQWPRHRFEIIVVDNGSSDGTRAVVEAAAGRRNAPAIRYLYVQKAGKSHAVNQALPHAVGELLAFTDDDVIPHPAWLERLSAAFAETGVDFVALCAAVFADGVDPKEAVARANAVLDETAPRFEAVG